MTRSSAGDPTEAARIWQGLKTSIAMTELQRFASMYNGTPEAMEARTRIVQINEYMRCYDLLKHVAPNIQSDQLGYARQALHGFREFLRVWPGTTHDAHIRDLVKDLELRLREAEAREAERLSRAAQNEREKDEKNRQRQLNFAIRDFAAIPASFFVSAGGLLYANSHLRGFNGEISANLSELVGIVVDHDLLLLGIVWWLCAVWMRTWYAALAAWCYVAIVALGAYYTALNWTVVTELLRAAAEATR